MEEIKANLNRKIVQVSKRVSTVAVEFIRCRVYRERIAYYCGHQSYMTDLRTLEFGVVDVTFPVCHEMYVNEEFQNYDRKKANQKLSRNGQTTFSFPYVGYTDSGNDYIRGF